MFSRPDSAVFPSGLWWECPYVPQMCPVSFVALTLFGDWKSEIKQFIFEICATFKAVSSAKHRNLQQFF